MKYKRILIKVSGESLMGDGQFGIDMGVVDKIAKQICEVSKKNIELCLVVGGGNIFRGLSISSKGMERASADYVGMLATVMNALILQNSLERMGVQSRVLSAIEMTSVCETYIRRRALRHLEHGRVVIFAAGSGNPFFTTDTAAALRAAEMGCEAFYKATNVDGVYDKDPKTNDDAKRYTELTFDDVISNKLAVMDQTAITLTKENDIPIIVFSVKGDDSIVNAVNGSGDFTIVKNN